MSSKDIADKVAVVGIGTTDFGAMYRNLDPQRTTFDVGIEAFMEALEDSGLTKDDIDGVLVTGVPDYARVCDVLGIKKPRFVNALFGGGRYAPLSIMYATMAINAGLADTIAVIYGTVGRSVHNRYGGEGGTHPSGMNDAAYGMTSPGAAIAHMYRRYQHLYHPKEEALGYFSINGRANAALNPKAVMRTPLTMEDYLNSRYISEPLRLLDYCLINDGGVCLILTRADRARGLKHPPAYIHAFASAGSTAYQNGLGGTADDCYYESLSMVKRDLFSSSEIQREDLDVLQIYENFTPVFLFTLEGLGWCPRGEAADFVTPELIARNGKLPINTSGGHTSESYMQGWALLAENVRQIRGEAGPLQVPGVETALYANAAPISNGIIFRK